MFLRTGHSEEFANKPLDREAQSHSVHVFQNKGAHERRPAGSALVRAQMRTRFHKRGGREAAGVYLIDGCSECHVFIKLNYHPHSSGA